MRIVHAQPGDVILAIITQTIFGTWRFNFGMTTNTAKILHLEDDEMTAQLVALSLRRYDVCFVVDSVATRSLFENALATGRYALVLSDAHLPGFDGLTALHFVRTHYANVPFIFLTGNIEESNARIAFQAGATDYISKDQLWRLPFSINNALTSRSLLNGVSSYPMATAANDLTSAQHSSMVIVPNLVQRLSCELLLPARRISEQTRTLLETVKMRGDPPVYEAISNIREQAIQLTDRIDELVTLCSNADGCVLRD